MLKDNGAFGTYFYMDVSFFRSPDPVGVAGTGCLECFPDTNRKGLPQTSWIFAQLLPKNYEEDS